MRDVDFISYACVDWRGIEHVDSLHIGMGILKHECAVLPPSNSSVAILEGATARIILPIEQTVDRSVSIRNVLPYPPGTLMKNNLCECSLSRTDCNII